MKTNAPEKIFIEVTPDGTRYYRDVIKEQRTENSDIEYIRKDSFIDKACELLVNCIEDFMARRMEIWDEECKKQTLDNLRNALKE